MFHVKHPNGSPKLHVQAGQIFVRAVMSACLSESETVREDKAAISASQPRVSVPNARLNLCRKAAGLVLRMSQLHKQRPREDVGCAVDF